MWNRMHLHKSWSFSLLLGRGSWLQVAINLKTNFPLKSWPHGLASWCKFAKPELAYRLVMGGKTDSQVGLQVIAKVVDCKYIQLTYDQLVSPCVGWPNAKKRASTCVWIWARRKSMQVGGQTKRQFWSFWLGNLWPEFNRFFFWLKVLLPPTSSQ